MTKAPLTRRFLLLGAMAAALSACSRSKFRRYNGPEVTRVLVLKGDRRMYLYHNDKVLKTLRR